MRQISNRSGVAGLLIAITFVVASLSSNASESLQLTDYEGKVVVLDFWASWCVPCRRSFPWMNEMQEKYGDDGLVVIAVNLDNEVADAEKFLQRYPAKFLIAYDHDRELAYKYEVQAMPSSYLIGRDGAVLEQHLGFKVANTATYEAAIVAALQAD